MSGVCVTSGTRNDQQEVDRFFHKQPFSPTPTKSVPGVQQQHSSSTTTAVLYAFAFVPVVTVYVRVVGAQQEIEPRRYFHVQCNDQTNTHRRTSYKVYKAYSSSKSSSSYLVHIIGMPMVPLFDMRRPRDTNPIPCEGGPCITQYISLNSKRHHVCTSTPNAKTRPLHPSPYCAHLKAAERRVKAPLERRHQLHPAVLRHLFVLDKTVFVHKTVS